MTRIVPGVPRVYRSDLRSRQAEETRECILDATVRVMAGGPASVSVPAVAREAGVSVPTVYRHFGTKRDLLAAVYPHLARRAGFDEVVAPDTVDGFREMVRVIFGGLNSLGGEARAAMASPAAEEARRTGMPDRIRMSRRFVDVVAPDAGPAERARITRVMVVLTTSSAMRVWRDHLGSSVDEASDDIVWMLRAAIAATRAWGGLMPSTAIRRLRDVRLTDAAEVGGKAASLGELLAAGVRVPDGVVLADGAAGMTAETRRSLLRTVSADLGAGPFAVRSSGTAEDGAEHSYAGVYETVLDVSADDLPAAADRVLLSASTARAAGYAQTAHGRMSVIVQRMVSPVAAGVALTADPISGDRDSCVVTAVRGIGERLVSGEAIGDEWVIRDGAATARRTPERALDRRAALRVASEARRIAAARGTPQDIEWAIDADDTLWILQARPMTALPPEVSWAAPAPGAFTRALRFGEWIAEPVTPLFESWLLTTMEDRLHECLRAWIGQHAPRPHHVVVNGWYFYSINWLGGAAMARSLPDILWHLVRSPRRVAGVIPPTVRHSVPIFEREWRTDLQPRYRAAVADAEARVETLPAVELPALVDGLAGLAGESFASIAALTGAAYKMEMNLARFYRRHLARSLGGSHLSLLAGFEPPTDPDRHAVASLDWWHAPVAHGASATRSAEDHAGLVEARRAAETAAYAALASSPRRLRAFRRLLAETQHLVPIREEQTRELTIAWPVMRRAVLRIGEELVARGAVGAPDDVFFMTRTEALAGLRGDHPVPSADVAARRAERAEQARLVPPLMVGRVNPILRRVWDSFPRQVGATRSERAIVSGAPASPGRATGPVRIIRGPAEFDSLLPGEILVAPLTAPAWTPLFTQAAAIVTDVGSAASHASIIAREYGIPAVVGCGDATARLRTGMRVTVDGATGNVEPE